ncbi:OPT oligopeptide transporter protein-domain-containing protein [Fomitopsis serialis]|uniref:OPT oligopeptide transporter protein-domain-containing protein n=1 Tax=Fomitopsis serialis TaxID=139415 RepID=UPI002007E15E|nr:OPT oligopeptide transporter protein-domain-containing protein [Neoantrodia serialis]KAH9919812.1 OPT oligopeptide transporter protein-domain-containing protein [Neoantrodia serialis]
MWQPLWFQLNSYIGICFTYILMSAVYYGDIWKAKNFPFMSQAIFAEDGSEYNQTALLTNGRFDPEKFEKLGPAYFSATNALGLVTANLSLGALSMNPWNKSVFLVYDVHYEKMKVYKQIPRWWYVIVLIGAYGCAQATYMVPGNPVANMYGALYGGQPISQGIGFLQDLKLGQYVKLAPRVTFCMQITGTVVGALLNYVMMLSIIENQRPALLSISGTRLWSGQNAQSYNSNAIAWGALAPHMFSPGSTYHIVPLSLVIGLFLPLPFFVAHRMWPKVGFNNFSTPIIMLYSCWLAVGINTQVNTTMAIGVFIQWWVRTRYPRWFTKYNYIVAAGLDGGTQVIMFILNLLSSARRDIASIPPMVGQRLQLVHRSLCASSQ